MVVEREGRKSVEEKREKAKGKESPFASHEILLLATNPGETMETESILRAGGHRFAADWHRSDREIEVSIFGNTRNCPPAFSSGSRFARKPLTVGPRSNLRPSPVPCFVVPMRTDEIRSSGQLVSGKYRSIVERKERKKTRGECIFGRESLFESRFDIGSHLVSLCFKSFLLLCSIAYGDARIIHDFE